MSRETLTHLAGYSTLTVMVAAVIGQPVTWLAAVPIVVATLVLAGYHGVDIIDEKTRVTARDQLRDADPGIGRGEP